MTPARLRLLVVVAALVAWASPRPLRAESATLTVFAAASLKDVFTAQAAAFEQEHPGVKVRLQFAGTPELRVQLEHGAQADLFAAADTKHMGALVKAGLALAPTLFAQNQLVLIAPRANPAALRSFTDLPRANRIVIGAPEVPIGAYTVQVLDNATTALGRPFRAPVEAKVVSRELNAKQIVAKVTLGEADAAFVYETDAKAAADKLTAIAVPPAYNVLAEYPIAVLKAAREKPLAEAWVASLRGPTGARLLRDAGFRVPPVAAPPATSTSAPAPAPKAR